MMVAAMEGLMAMMMDIAMEKIVATKMAMNMVVAMAMVKAILLDLMMERVLEISEWLGQESQKDLENLRVMR